MSKKLENLKDRPSDFDKFLDNDDLNCSYVSSLDSDCDTQDPDILAEEISPLYSNYTELEGD
jgi:hypothetical protein